MANRWIQAASLLSPTIKVCGRKLLPFCLRHRVALQAIDSPILDVNADIRAEDVMNAVKILSTHNLEDFRKPISFFEMIHLKNMKVSKKKLKEEARKLLIYFESQSLWPRFWESDKKTGKDIGVDWPLVIVANLTKNGCTLEESWTMPESQAVWLHIANMISEGIDVKLVTDKEWEAMEADRLESQLTAQNN